MEKLVVFVDDGDYPIDAFVSLLQDVLDPETWLVTHAPARPPE